MSPDEVRNALRRVLGHLAHVELELAPLASWDALEDVELRESIQSCSEVVQELLLEVDEAAELEREASEASRSSLEG